MAHTNTNYPVAIKVRLPETMAGQLEALASAGVLNLSDHVRIAIDQYLRTGAPITSIAPTPDFVERRENR